MSPTFVAVVAVVAVVAGQGERPVDIAVAARSIQPGEVVRVAVGGLAPNDAGHVRVFGRLFPLFAQGPVHVALVGIDLDVAPGIYTAVVETTSTDAPKRIGSRTLTVRAKAFPTRRLTVEPRFVDPPPAEARRIAQDAQRLAALWASRTPAAWSGAFVAPVPDPATSAFGSRSIFNGQPRSPHGGADFSSPAGRAIVAPGAGRVVLVDDLYFTGRTVVIDHGMGLLSLFAHLSEFEVKVDQPIARGDAVGQVGATGRVTGAHLHWTVRLAGTRVDPLSLIAASALGR